MAGGNSERGPAQIRESRTICGRIEFSINPTCDARLESHCLRLAIDDMLFSLRQRHNYAEAIWTNAEARGHQHISV